MQSIRKKILKEGEIIPLIFDFSFTEVFNNIKYISILERFISDHMMIPLEEVKGNLEILPRRLNNRKKEETRKEVDLILNYKGEKIEIELNGFGPYKRVNDRNLVYIAKILGENYQLSNKEIQKAYQINISNYPCNKCKLINEYYIKEKESEEIFSDKLQIDQIDVSKCLDPCYNFLNEREEKVAKWIKLFVSNNIVEFATIGEELMDKEELDNLKDKIEELSDDENMVDVYKTYEDNFDLYDDAKEAGFEDGFNDGEKQTKINSVKNMLKSNYSVEEIAVVTGLTIDDILKIKKS